jgi:hypothetical protein
MSKKQSILRLILYAVVLVALMAANSAYASMIRARPTALATLAENTQTQAEAQIVGNKFGASPAEAALAPQSEAASAQLSGAGVLSLESSANAAEFASDIASLSQTANLSQVSGQAGTSFQQSLMAAISDRQADGLPVPAEVSFDYEFSVDSVPQARILNLDQVTDANISITSTTVVKFTNPQQAGYDKWPDLTFDQSNLSGAEGFVKAGNYNQAVKDWLAQQLPGIWDQYEYGYEPRQYTFVETYEINYSESEIVKLAAALADVNAGSSVEEILLGFTFTGPAIDYTIEEKFETCVIACVTWAEFKAGFALDWGLGLRLPMEVNLNSPDPVTEGVSFNPTTSIAGRDWSAADFTAAGVPAENGNEFVMRFELFLGGSIKILGAEILGANIDETIAESRSFATPFGPDSSFPLPTLNVPVWEPDLTVADLSFGFGFKPNLTSDEITANWSAGGDATGAGTVTYTDDNVAFTFGPVNPVDGPGQADLLLKSYRYWFSQFLMEISAFIDFDVFGFDAARIDIPITDFDLSFITGNLYVAAHDGTSDNVNLSVAIVDVPAVVKAGPDQTVDEGALVSLAPATFTDSGVTDVHTATIDWGDSMVEPGAVLESGGTGTVSGKHAYGDNGVYTVVVTVCEGLSCGSDSLIVTVNNVVPTVDAGSDMTIHEGDMLNLATTFVDPGFLDTHTAAIDWGDGSSSEAGTVSFSAGTGSVAGAHVYLDDGVYTATVEVCDDDGGCGADSFKVTVLNVPPTVAPIVAPIEKLVGALFTASAAFTDPGVLDTHTAVWDWGDGVVEPGTLTQGAGFGSVQDTHAYFTCRVFTMTLTVTDDDGGAGSASHNITILTPREGILRLIEMVKGLGLDHGIENSLVAKLENALAALDRGQSHVAVNMLSAFINEVEAQQGKKIGDGDAVVLIQWAQEIIAALEAGLCVP